MIWVVVATLFSLGEYHCLCQVVSPDRINDPATVGGAIVLGVIFVTLEFITAALTRCLRPSSASIYNRK
jgi:hypothetical protein